MKTKHVALIAEDGLIVHHEELPEEDAPRRLQMFSLQTELNAMDRKGPITDRAILAEEWPPAEQKLVKRRGKTYLEALPAESAEPEVPPEEPEPAPPEEFDS